MKIKLNGHSLVVADGTTLMQLIEQEGMMGKRLAAEVNLDIIPKAEHENHLLQDNDVVEVVHAIGGG